MEFSIEFAQNSVGRAFGQGWVWRNRGWEVGGVMCCSDGVPS